MNIKIRIASAAATLVAGVGLMMTGPVAALAAPPGSGVPAASPGRAARVCANAPMGYASCMAYVRTDIGAGATIGRAAGDVRPMSSSPAGLNPADLRSAYKLTSSGSSSQTVAIVDAQDDPTAEADLATYRAQFGLPACTTANGCFRKVDQNGGSSYPATDAGWALEISLDLDMVSAICPNCHILLVEASSASFGDLGAAVDRAAAMGADAISNSYGGAEWYAALFGYQSHYNHAGVAITASSGDGGYGVSFPASSHYVTAVGGTRLTAAGNSRGWTEIAWSGAGSGCSSYFAALSGASSFDTGCSRRAMADVSAVADPASGVSVYDSTPYSGQSGWWVVGGTSASSPIIASVYALAGNESGINNNYPYSHSSSFFDITSGSNGTCSPSQWCNARTGWDGPTGLGTPNGTGGF